MRNLVFIIALGLTVYALVDCIQARRDVRALPWGAWVVVILIPFLGPVAYLLAGRPTSGQSPGGWAKAPGSAPAGPARPAPAAPLGPDDDPEFLAALHEEQRHEQMLRDWEAQLREREDGPEDPDRAAGSEDEARED